MLQQDTRDGGRGGTSGAAGRRASPDRTVSSVIYGWSHAPAVAHNPAAARCSARRRLGVDPKTVGSAEAECAGCVPQLDCRRLSFDPVTPALGCNSGATYGVDR
jgi:hypothetical protein